MLMLELSLIRMVSKFSLDRIRSESKNQIEMNLFLVPFQTC